MTKDPRVYLAQILERIDRVAQYTAAGHGAFLEDAMMQDAVIRSFEVIGQSGRRVQRCPCVPRCVRCQYRLIALHAERPQ
jgi:uncharacterized protein with HEPN domain